MILKIIYDVVVAGLMGAPKRLVVGFLDFRFAILGILRILEPKKVASGWIFRPNFADFPIYTTNAPTRGPRPPRGYVRPPLLSLLLSFLKFPAKKNF